MQPLRTLRVPLLVTACAVAAGPAAADLLPLECDDGASVTIGYFDSSPEITDKRELGECHEAPVGDWNRVGILEQTDAASADILGLVRSDDGLVLELTNRIALDVQEHEFAAAANLVEAHALVHAPEADDPVPADVIVEITRDGDLDTSNLSLAVIGPGVNELQSLDDEPDGEHHVSVELEPGEDYRAVLVASSALAGTGSGSEVVRLRVDTTVPEPGAVVMVTVGAATMALVRRLGRRQA